MKPPHLPTLILDTLLRPSRLVAFLASGPGATRWAFLAAAEVLGVTAGLLIVLSLFIPFGPVALILGPGLALVLAMIGMLPPLFSLPFEQPTRVRLTFGLTRTLIVTAPPTTLGLVITFSTAFPSLQRDPLVALAFLVASGVWFGGALTVALLVSSQRHQTPMLRWVGVVGALLIGALIWWSEPLRQSEAIFIPFVCLGFALGLLRPLSYLWEAPLSLGLALSARLGAPAHRLLDAHPVNLDELCLIPLPGLTTLLARACAADITTGGPWLVQVAQHPSQGGAARRALGRLLRGDHAHIVLFWLSTHEDGATWLQQLCTTTARPHPLIAAYAALAAVGEPAAWPSVIRTHYTAIHAAASQPGGVAVQALLDAGAHVLTADRWPMAMAALSNTPSSAEFPADPFWHALATMRDWSDRQVPALLPDRAQALAALWDSLNPLDGWPAALLDAMAEHLVYLLLVEHRRGAWLV